MRKSQARWMGTLAGALITAVLLAACSQGYSASGTGSPPGVPAGAKPVNPSGGPAASGPMSKSDTAYRQRTIQADVSGSLVSVSVQAIDQAGNTSFTVGGQGGNMSFMAYRLDGRLHVRADICPPCGSRSFTLQSGRLVCDACGTVFNAATGAGMRGACVAYPKASVPYQVAGPRITMTMQDLETAYRNTLTRKG